MQFPKQKMSDSDILKSKPIKEIEKHLKAVDVDGVLENNHRVYRNPSSGKNAVIYTLGLSGGMKLILWVSAQAHVVRVELNHDVVESADRTEDEADITPREIATEILKKIRAEDKAEFKVKIDKRKLGQLIDELDNKDEEQNELMLSRLTALKQDLTKGSGKLIVLNSRDEFYGRNGWTKEQSEIVIFDELQDAENIKDKNKIVRI